MGASQLRPTSRPPPRPGAYGRTKKGKLARASAPWAFAALVVLAPQWLGGIYPDAMAATAIAAGVALSLAMASARARDLPSGLLLGVALGPLAWTAMQVTPLPCAIVDALAPLSAERWRQAHALFGLGEPGSCLISRDPGATREEVVKGLAITCALLSAALLAARGQQRLAFGAVGVSVGLMAVVAIAHAAVGAERVYGLYMPVELRNARFIAPLINPNNLGGFLALGIPVLIGLALEQDEKPPLRFGLLCAVGVVAAAALMTRSRGAAGAVALGPMLYLGLAVARVRLSDETRRARRQRIPWWLRMSTPLGIVLVLGLAGYAWLDELIAEFAASGWDKIDLIVRGSRFATTVPFMGVGRGGFSAAFLGSVENHYRFDYAENMLVQWAVDWGVIPALALALSFCMLVGRAARRARSHARIGALAGVITVAAQNLVDLGLELLGPAVVAAGLLGAAVTFPQDAPTLQSSSKSGPRRPAFARRTLLATLAALALLVPAVLAPRLIEEHGPNIEQRLPVLVEAKDRKRFAQVVQRGMLAHPSEPMFAIWAAHEALVHRDSRAGRFINRGMLLAPGWAAPHVQAAQWLWNRGLRRQAFVELRAGAELEVHAINSLLCPMAKIDAQGAYDAAPKPPSRAMYLERIAQCLPVSVPVTRQIDAELRRVAPHFDGPFMREAHRLLAENKPREAAEHALQVVKLDPSYTDAADLAARALALDGQTTRALQVLATAAENGGDPFVLHRRAARLAAAAKDAAGVQAALEPLRGWSAGDGERLHSVYLLEGKLQTELGNYGAALKAYDEAYRLAEKPEALRAVASTAEHIGDLRRALSAYASLCELHPEIPDVCKHRDRLRGTGLNR
jgi:tetratricopeptide (TPR) repeat protein